MAEAVEYTANRYFTEDESPLVLIINTDSFSERLEWRDPTPTEPWQRPLANIDNLPLSAVLDTNVLVSQQDGAGIMYKWERA